MRRIIESSGIAIVLLAQLLIGCEQAPTGVRAVVAFKDVEGLRSGDPVELNGIKVGEVSAVETGAGEVKVRLRLEAAQASGVRQEAVALIVSEPDRRAVRLYNPPGQGPAVTDGATLKGFDSLLDLTVWQTTGTVNALQETFKQTSDALQRYFHSQEWQQNKREMEDLIKSIPAQSDAVMEDIIKQFDELMRELESKTQDGEVEIKHRIERAQRRFQALAEAIDQQRYVLQARGETAAALEKLRASADASVRRFEAQSQAGVTR